MPRILVLYGTTTGHTARIASALASALHDEGMEAEVAAADHADPRPEGYAGVIVAASVHAGNYQAPVRRWVESHIDALKEMPTAFVSVSLGVLQRDAKVQQEVAAIVDRFLVSTGWSPAMAKSVAGALLYTRYNWITRWMMKRIARKAGGDTDTTRDYIYTDWDEVRAFAVQFAGAIRTASRARTASDAAVA